MARKHEKYQRLRHFFMGAGLAALVFMVVPASARYASQVAPPPGSGFDRPAAGVERAPYFVPYNTTQNNSEEQIEKFKAFLDDLLLQVTDNDFQKLTSKSKVHQRSNDVAQQLEAMCSYASLECAVLDDLAVVLGSSEASTESIKIAIVGTVQAIIMELNR